MTLYVCCSGVTVRPLPPVVFGLHSGTERLHGNITDQGLCMGSVPGFCCLNLAFPVVVCVLIEERYTNG